MRMMGTEAEFMHSVPAAIFWRDNLEGSDVSEGNTS